MEKSDSALRLEVEALIQQEATVDSSHIQVSAELGFINLNGSVTSEEQKQNVEILIRDKTQAKAVFNYLVVRPVGLMG